MKRGDALDFGSSIEDGKKQTYRRHTLEIALTELANQMLRTKKKAEITLKLLSNC